MSWRTVVISSRCKLDMSLGYLQVRREDVTRIHLSEIGTLIVESTAVSMTAALMVELSRRKVKIIFCDEQRNPAAEVMPCYAAMTPAASCAVRLPGPKSERICSGPRLFARKSESNRPCFSTRMRRSERRCWKPMLNM